MEQQKPSWPQSPRHCYPAVASACPYLHSLYSTPETSSIKFEANNKMSLLQLELQDDFVSKKQQTWLSISLVRWWLRKGFECGWVVCFFAFLWHDILLKSTWMHWANSSTSLSLQISVPHRPPATLSSSPCHLLRHPAAMVAFERNLPLQDFTLCNLHASSAPP